MKIRLRLFAIAMTMLCFVAINTNSFAAAALTKDQAETRVAAINQRVEQIRAMDLKHLDKVQRTSLRHELRDMKSELRSMGPLVIVISMGVLIVVIVLLILLL